MNHSKIKSIVNSIQAPIHSRIAPTPSGFLHKGNAFSFLLTWFLVRKTNGTLTLRIDDSDAIRKRPEYVQDIFDTLHFLEIDWDKGAQNPKDFEDNYSQHHFLEIYKKEIEILKTKNAIFPCSCSRLEIQKRNVENKINPTPTNYDGFCLVNGNAKNQKNYALRLNTNYFDKEAILIKDSLGTHYEVNLAKEMPFFVVQKKDNLPAYQLISLLDDQRMHINFVVRGKDLLHSTAAQLFLAKILDTKSFLKTTFLHHDLIKDKEGNKISKSAGSKYDNFSIKYFREKGGTKKEFLNLFEEWINMVL